MEIYTGTDIIEIDRIKDAIKSDTFIKKIFTEKEIEYCESKKDPARIQSYAARFAAKEAIFKAISKVLPLDYGIEWKSIEILKEETGRPYVNLKIDNKKKAKIKNRCKFITYKRLCSSNSSCYLWRIKILIKLIDNSK